MDLPNEIWFTIVNKLRYIDVLSFSVVCKIFHLLCLGYENYRKILRISKVILGSDTFEFLSSVFARLCDDILAGFNDVFKNRRYIISIIRLKLKKIQYELLPLKIHEHLFFCKRGTCQVVVVTFAEYFTLAMMKKYF